MTKCTSTQLLVETTLNTIQVDMCTDILIDFRKKKNKKKKILFISNVEKPDYMDAVWVNQCNQLKLGHGNKCVHITFK